MIQALEVGWHLPSGDFGSVSDPLNLLMVPP